MVSHSSKADMFLILFLGVAVQGLVIRPRQYDGTGWIPEGFPKPPEGFPKPPEGFPKPPEGFPKPPEGFPKPPEGFPQIPFYPSTPQEKPEAPQKPQSDTPFVQYDEVPTSSTPIPILKFEYQPNTGDGSYQYSYETGNGIKAEQKGFQKEVGDPAEFGTAVVGSYSYTDTDGNPVQVSYTADENGFVPTGDHLPTSPPIPYEILVALERNMAQETMENGGVVPPAYHHLFKAFYGRNMQR